jgi:hypothetical protein
MVTCSVLGALQVEASPNTPISEVSRVASKVEMAVWLKNGSVVCQVPPSPPIFPSPTIFGFVYTLTEDMLRY